MNEITEGNFPEVRSRQEMYLQDIIKSLSNESISDNNYPDPLSRQEAYLQIIISKLRANDPNIEINTEDIEKAVNKYLEQNPIQPGATENQAQQIEKNKKDVASLKAETGSLKEDLDSYLPTEIAWTDGKMVSNSGEITNESDRSISDYIYCKNVNSVKYKAETQNNYVNGISFFDSHKQYISGQSNTGSGEQVVEVPNNAYYFVLSIMTSDKNNSYYHFEQPLLLKNVKILNDNIDDVNSELNKYDEMFVDSNNIFNKMTVTKNCYIVNDDLYDSADFCTSDYIDVFENEKIVIGGKGNGTGTTISFFDENRLLLSYVSNDTQDSKIVNVPSNAHFIRFSFNNENLDFVYVNKGSIDKGFDEYGKFVTENKVKDTCSKFVFPDKLYVPKGIECNIFWDNILFGNANKQIYINSEISYPRFCRLKSLDPGNSVRVIYSVNEKLVKEAQKSFTKIVVDTNELSNPNLLFLGDSFTDMGEYCWQVVKNLKTYGVEPVCIGTNKNITIPTVTIDGESITINREGLSGGTLSAFVTNTPFNPWWDSDTNTNNIPKYLSGNNLPTPDYVVVQFTWNDLGLYGDKGWNTDINGVISNLKKLADAFKKANTNVKIIFSIEPCGALRSCNYDVSRKKASVLKFAEKLFNEFNEQSDYSFIKIAPSYAWVDRINGYNSRDITFAYSDAAEKIADYENGNSWTVHPKPCGMRQIGDCVTGVLLALMKGIIN